MEIWKDIPNWEGHYQVSSIGNVRSLDKLVRGAGGLKMKKGKLRKIVINNTGYPVVMLSKEGSIKLKSVHRLMGVAFLPNPENKRCVRHLDDNRLNNILSN